MASTTILPDVMTVSQARANLYSLVEESSKKLRRFRLTHRRKRLDVTVISTEELESWEETVEIMSNKKLMRQIAQGEKDIREGRIYTLDQVLKELKIKR